MSRLFPRLPEGAGREPERFASGVIGKEEFLVGD
jgi:hypothetical protein